MIASHYAKKVPWLKQLLSHVDLDTRESAARLLGIASSNLPIATSSDIISELIATISRAQKLRFVYSQILVWLHFGCIDFKGLSFEHLACVWANAFIVSIPLL